VKAKQAAELSEKLVTESCKTCISSWRNNI